MRGLHLVRGLVLFLVALGKHRSVLSKQDPRGRLYHRLFDEYDQDVRPTLAPPDVVEVHFIAILSHIVEVDAKKQILTANLWLHMMWYDPRLEWNKADYGNVTTLVVPDERVWKPDVVLYQNADSAFDGWAKMHVLINNDGTVVWEHPAIVMSACEMDVSAFPFDSQVCTLTFGPWVQDATEVLMISDSAASNLKHFSANVGASGWDVLSLNARDQKVSYDGVYWGTTPKNFSETDITIHLRRKPTFYVFNLLLPCVLLAVMMAATFLLPIDNGEKVSFGVSILLALVVFQLLMVQLLPESESLPWIGKFVIIAMVLMAASLAISTIVINVCSRATGPGKRPLGPWTRRVFLRYTAKILLMGDLSQEDQPYSLIDGRNNVCEQVPMASKTVQSFVLLPGSSDDVDKKDDNAASAEMLDIMRGIKKGLDSLLIYYEEKEKVEGIESEWKLLAKVLDRICLLLYLVGASTCLLAFYFSSTVITPEDT
ncbi:PREDICTED: neuronal acetylcholine receptor subunit alpha-10-like [Branchiostoma belcheri]|uniref:Neuronal acetylcholine receptor subunit alpha-10-like n=1 Tax=Branchiostoma belcheri TaxID=7741 RepID=A0A6P4Y8K5_BRABE|nr:PREDICTED: neuronal acetylcholine receptor subunit alpha-10-like [Branchiostoma belcheri]